MIQVLLVEDSLTDRVLMKKMLEKTGIVEVVAEAGTGLKALEVWRQHRTRVAVVDINLPDISGLEVASALVEEDPGILLVFATSNRDYLSMAFDYFAYDYLVKPFEYQRISMTFKRIAAILGEQGRSLQHEKAGGGSEAQEAAAGGLGMLTEIDGALTVVDPNRILMITRVSRKTQIITEERVIDSPITLEYLESILPRHFMRTHRGFIVNLKRIHHILPWGKKTHVIRFEGVSQTALITQDRLKILKSLYIVL